MLLNLIIITLLLILIVSMVYVINLAQILFNQTNKNIRDAVQSEHLDLSPSTQGLIDVAVEVWRLEQRLEKASGSLSDNQNKAFQNSLTKLQRFLEKSDISTIDYTDQKYNEGLNLDVLSIEKDPKASGSIIKNTHEPAVLHKGQLIKKAKVVILEK